MEFGYRYDTETGLYYLQLRYYNPEWGRFINADGVMGQTGELLGHNLLAYAKNNPVNMSDPSGFRPIFDSKEEEAEYYQWKTTQRVLNDLSSEANNEKDKRFIEELAASGKNMKILRNDKSNLSEKYVHYVANASIQISASAVTGFGFDTFLARYIKDSLARYALGSTIGYFLAPNSITAGVYHNDTIFISDGKSKYGGEYVFICFGPKESGMNGITTSYLDGTLADSIVRYRSN